MKHITEMPAPAPKSDVTVQQLATAHALVRWASEAARSNRMDAMRKVFAQHGIVATPQLLDDLDRALN